MKKGILWITFVLLMFGCTTVEMETPTDDSKWAGEVNGRKIERRFFTETFLHYHYDLTKGNKSYQPTEQELQKLEEKTWDYLIRNAIVENFKEKNRITCNDDEVIDSLLTNPPAVLVNSGRFDTNGSFDRNKYAESIKTNSPVDTRLARNTIKTELIFNKISQELSRNVKITEDDVEDYFNHEYSKSSIYLLSMYKDDIDVNVNEEEAKINYQRDKNKYYYKPSLSIKYMKMPVRPLDNELINAKNTMDSLYFQLKNSLDFDRAVREFSSNLRSYPGGKMPFISMESVPKIIKDKVTNAKIGEVITPVVKNNVYYIYKILDKTKSLVKLQELKYPVPISRSTILERREEMLAMKELIKSIGIEKTAYEYGCELGIADSLNNTRSYVDGLGDVSDLLNDATDKYEGYIYSPIYDKNDRNIVIIQISENRLNKKKPFNLVKDEIKNTIKRNKQKKLASMTMKSYINDILDEPNKLYDRVTVIPYKNVTKNSNIEGLDSKFNEAVLALSDKGDHTECFSDTEKYYIGVLFDREKGDANYLKANYFIIENEYRKDRLSNYFSIWLEDEVKNAKVKKMFSMKEIYKRVNK